ncbi:uncharacterized protein Pyn_22108 [Prunus yedoensis var. nudiflora]|uniref:C2H2-type domain-containing protein n=1 Tax=Prunus yedoensis var. nudiflora TaxID=2094558 RepID=A0A314UTL9_PRUYE|nr:uncharacterized protein Pyn_22108 [Prunus yedoensis var. nudiflora]
MDGQQDNAIQPFDEAWFDVANPCGKEFELPNASSPIHPRWSDNSNNLVFLLDQQLHTPDVLENSYELETIRSSCAGNQVDSCPIREMGTSIANFVPIVNPQEGTSIGNHKVHFPRSTGVLKSEFEGVFPDVNQHVYAPTSASYSWKGVDINFPLRNQSLMPLTLPIHHPLVQPSPFVLKNNPTHAPRFPNTSGFGSGGYIPPNKQLTHFCTSSNAFRLNSDDYIINDRVCSGFHFTILGLISNSGSSSSFGSSGCRPVRNQEIRSSSFTGSPSLQNGLSVQSNQVAYKFGGSANGDINHGSSHLQAVSHGTGITSNVPVPVENQVETSTRAPRSNCHGSEKNRTFGPSSSKNGRCDVKYTCKICKREFPNYNSLGGHMSFHAKMKRRRENWTAKKMPSHKLLWVK